MIPQTAKIFMNGRSQAVRLPKAFRFDGDEVFIRRKGDQVILSPKAKNWREFFEETELPTEDFMTERSDTPPQKREEIF